MVIGWEGRVKPFDWSGRCEFGFPLGWVMKELRWSIRGAWRLEEAPEAPRGNLLMLTESRLPSAAGSWKHPCDIASLASSLKIFTTWDLHYLLL